MLIDVVFKILLVNLKSNVPDKTELFLKYCMFFSIYKQI